MGRRRFSVVELSIGMAIILIIGAIGASKLWKSRIATNEASTVSSLRTLHSTLATYKSTYPKTGFPASLSQLAEKHGLQSCSSAGLLDNKMANDAFTKSGYDFVYTLTEGSGFCPPTAFSVPGLNYTITADPSVKERTGIRHFFLDSSGVIRQKPNEKAGPADDPAPLPSLAPTRVPSPSEFPKGLMLPDTVILKSFIHVQLRGVKFDHKAHAETRMIDCVMCHHPPKQEKPTTTAYQACSICHESVVRIPMKTNAQKAFHDAAATSGTCIDCHKAENSTGKKAPVKCIDCHTHANI